MALTMSSTEQLAVTNGVRFMVFAPPKHGKTMLAATLPNPIIISAENGLLSLSKENIEKVWGVGTQGITYNLNVLRIENFQDFKDAYNWCCSNPQYFESIAIDSITEIAEKILEVEVPKAKDPRKAYMEMQTSIIEYTKKFRDFPIPEKHVYMSAKLGTTKDEMSGVTKYGPGMPGNKLGPQLPYLFDEIFRLGIKRDLQTGIKTRFLQTDADEQYDCGDRSGKLEPLEYPHLGYIINKIRGNV